MRALQLPPDVLEKMSFCNRSRSFLALLLLGVTLIVGAVLYATRTVPSDELEDDHAYIDILSRQATTSDPCTLPRKPPYPRPSGGPHEYVVRTCFEGEIQQAIAEMNKNLRGTLFLYCERPTTLFLRRSLHLNRLGSYRIIGNGKIILNGRGTRPILSVGGDGRLELHRISFRDGRVTTTVGGGAVASFWRTKLIVVDCVFRGHRSTSTQAFGGGAAIRGLGGDVRIWSSIFTDNQASTGGAVHVTSGNLDVYNSEFRNNFVFGGLDDRSIKTGHGGAVRVDRVKKRGALPVVICGCDFENNGIITTGSTVDLGGALEVYTTSDHLPSSGDKAVLLQTSFIRNGRTGDATNIVMLHGAGKTRLVDVRFVGNYVSRQTLRIGSGPSYTATLNRVTFAYNRDDGRFFTLNLAQCRMNNVFKDGKRVYCNSI